MKVYLAGPIFGKTDEECHAWRSFVKQEVQDVEFVDPMDRDYRGLEGIAPAEIVNEDKKAIIDCDCVFANMSEASAGTTMEVMFAFELRKYVICWKEQCEDWSPWVLMHSDSVCIGLKGAIQHCLLPLIRRDKNRRMINR